MKHSQSNITVISHYYHRVMINNDNDGDDDNEDYLNFPDDIYNGIKFWVKL